jgi:hypothetical protein
VQQVPDGNAFAVIWVRSPDSEQATAEVTRDTSEFAAWFRGQVEKLSGIELDPAQPLQGAPELLVDWRA